MTCWCWIWLRWFGPICPRCVLEHLRHLDFTTAFLLRRGGFTYSVEAIFAIFLVHTMIQVRLLRSFVSRYSNMWNEKLWRQVICAENYYASLTHTRSFLWPRVRRVTSAWRSLRIRPLHKRVDGSYQPGFRNAVRKGGCRLHLIGWESLCARRIFESLRCVRSYKHFMSLQVISIFRNIIGINAIGIRHLRLVWMRILNDS